MTDIQLPEPIPQKEMSWPGGPLLIEMSDEAKAINQLIDYLKAKEETNEQK